MVLVAIAAGERTTEESGVVDAGLCHGAGGATLRGMTANLAAVGAAVELEQQ